MVFLYYGLVLLFAFLIMVIYDQYDAFLLGMMLALFPLPLYGLGKWAGRHFQSDIRAPSLMVRGEAEEIGISLKNPLLPFLPLPEVSVDGFPYESYEDGPVFFFTKEASHCGRVDMGKVSLSWQDPSRLFTFHKDIPSSSYIVYPKKIGNRDAALRSLMAMTSSEDKEYFGATLYHPGDNPRLINWKITARKEEVYVRDSYPESSAKIILAADYEEDGNARDLVCDTLYSLGLALLSARIPFLFLFRSGRGTVSEKISNRESFENSLSGFLRGGRDHALEGASLPPSIPLCYITSERNPSIPPSLSPYTWCVREGGNAYLSGKAGISHALGGIE